MRSNRRDISGAAATMRAEISFLQRPSVPAPRRMRRTLYCCWVMSNWRSNLSAVFDSSEGAVPWGGAQECFLLQRRQKGKFLLQRYGQRRFAGSSRHKSFFQSYIKVEQASEAADGLRHRTEDKAVSLESSTSISVTFPLIADGQLATLMSRCLDLIYQGGGVVLKGNAAAPFSLAIRLVVPSRNLPVYARRLEVSGRAEVGPVDVRRFEDAESLFV